MTISYKSIHFDIKGVGGVGYVGSATFIVYER